MGYDDWPGQMVPAEFILQQVQLPRGESPLGTDGPQIWRGENLDWDWSRSQAFHFMDHAAQTLTALKYMTDWAARSYWITFSDRWPGDQSLTWVRVEPLVAQIVIEDYCRRNTTGFYFETLLFTSDEGVYFGALGGCMAKDCIWLSMPLASMATRFEWPAWALLVFDRHPDHDWAPGIQDSWSSATTWGSLSFYLFCVEAWAPYVMDQWNGGTDDALRHTVETMHLLDQYDDAQYLTIWDDIAIAYFSDHPPRWVARIPQFVDPDTLIPDMVTAEGLQMLREKVARRNMKRKD